MDLTSKILRYAFIGLMLFFVAAVIYGAIKKGQYEAAIVKLQNSLAARDQTIESQDGVYQKLVIQSQDLKSLLDQKDEQVKALTKQLKSNNEQLLTANSLIIKLKKDLLSSGNASTPDPKPENPNEVRVDFDSKKDFLPFQVTGFTLGDCQRKVKPSANMKLSQVRPLKLNVVVSQGKDGAWRTSTTSSEENFQIDIALAAVNPYMLEPKWYEHIGIGLDMGVGTGPGFLAGLGVSYAISKFEVGPKAWVVIDRAGTAPYFGAQLLWHPFQK